MTRLLIAYDGSSSARAAIAFASALFPAADATVAHVHAPPPSPDTGALARIALPDAVIQEGLDRMTEQAHAEGRRQVDEGTELARAAGLDAHPQLRFAITAWRELQTLAEEVDADLIVCGTRGNNPFQRVLVGSTASSLLHHADRPLLIVPDCELELEGPILAGYDGSATARKAITFATTHLATRELLVATAWHAPVLLTVPADPAIDLWIESSADLAEDGATRARDAGVEATAITADGTRGQWRALLEEAAMREATLILVGSRGRGAVTSTVLGSVASGLVHAASRPVLVVP